MSKLLKLDPTKRQFRLPAVALSDDVKVMRAHLQRLHDLAARMLERYDKPLEALDVLSAEMKQKRRIEAIFAMWPVPEIAVKPPEEEK